MIIDGSAFEDDNIRSINHFYDPIHERAPLAVSEMSPDWMLEDRFDVDPQAYSWKDTNEAFYRALTLPTETERNAEWGKVFESLGRIVHHIQDMAQPQHVRNDLHCPIPLCEAFDTVLLLGAFNVYNPSLYEEYSGRKIAGDISMDFILDYPIPVFDTAREYWTTKDTDTGVLNRRGLADFTNRNFVSTGSNFTIMDGLFVANSDYTLPSIQAITTETLTSLTGDASKCQALISKSPVSLPPDTPCEIEFITTDVNDSLNKQRGGVNTRASSLSIFDQNLADYNIDEIVYSEEDDDKVYIVDRLFSLNNINFQQMDLEYLTFPPATFDIATSSFGLFFLEDMIHGLRNIAGTSNPEAKLRSPASPAKPSRRWRISSSSATNPRAGLCRRCHGNDWQPKN